MGCALVNKDTLYGMTWDANQFMKVVCMCMKLR